MTSTLLAQATNVPGPYVQSVNSQVNYGISNGVGNYGSGIGYIPNAGSCVGSSCGSGITSVAGTILYLINSVLVPLIFAVSFIVFLYGVASTYIFSHGEPAEVEKGHKVILWGLIGFVAMVSLWGLVNVVANTFGLNGIVSPGRLPTSY